MNICIIDYRRILCERSIKLTSVKDFSVHDISFKHIPMLGVSDFFIVKDDNCFKILKNRNTAQLDCENDILYPIQQLPFEIDKITMSELP